MWEHNHFYRPTDLREWIGLREAWEVAEVAKRLALAPRSAGQLLRSLGYEEGRAGLWRSSMKWRAQRRRREWLRDEDEQTTFEELAPKGQPWSRHERVPPPRSHGRPQNPRLRQ